MTDGSAPRPGPLHHVPPPPTPRKVRSPVRLRPRDGVVVHTALSGAWLGAAASRLGDEAAAAGIEYARMGQVASFEVRIGCVSSRVQGTQSRPYGCEFIFRPLPDDFWESVVEACAEEAIHLVRLMGGEIPDALHAVLAEKRIELLPADAGHLTMRCSCSTFAETGTCRHLGAAAYVLADRLTTDPLHALTLRGLPPGVLIERVRQARAIRARGRASAHADPHLPEAQIDAPPLEESFGDFWRPGAEFAEVEERTPTMHVRCALLRRLGPSPLGGRFPLVGLLESIFETIATDARAVRGVNDTED